MNDEHKSRPSIGNRLASLLPIATWLPQYQRQWLRTDLLAGLAIWAMTVPQALGYAGIAGVPPVYGLYAVPLAMIAYALFGTSRTLCVGPESAIAIISAVTIGGIVSDDPDEFLVLTSMMALLVGGLFLLFGLLRLGWVANFLSQPVLQGFTMGIALTVIAGQIPILLGTETEYGQMAERLSELVHTGFFVKSWAIIATLGTLNLFTAVVGISALVLLFAMKQFVPLAPAALIAVLLSVLAVLLFGLESRGVKVIGEVESGMVQLSLPSLNLEQMAALMPGALAIVLLGYSVSLSVAVAGAKETGEEIDANQEKLVALGMSNLGAAVSSGFVVCGSLSRGVVIRGAGGKSQVVSLINAGLVLLTLLFLLPLFFKLPSATLAAVVIQAMCGLLKFGYLKRLFHIDKGEFAYAMAAMFGVLIFGILQGVAIGVVLSLAILIRRVSHPWTAVLGRMPGTDDFRDVEVQSSAETIPGILVFRFDAPMIFCNCGYFAEQVRRHVAEADPPIQHVLLAANQINQLDSTAADQLTKLQEELAAKQIRLTIAEAKEPLREMIRRTGLEETIGTEYFYESIADGVSIFSGKRITASTKSET